MKILYVASEAVPFIASGGLADVAGSVTKAIRSRGHACRVVLPLYGDVAEEHRQSMKFVTSFSVPLSWRNQYCGLFEANHNGVIFYFLDNEYYFRRQGLYGFYDDAERFAFFSKAVLEMLEYIDFEPDIIHCNDWQTAMVPTYLNVFYRAVPKFQHIRTVFTIHNIQYQGQYGMEIATDVLGIPTEAVHLLAYKGDLNFMKGAIEQCDLLTTVSPTYAGEILDPWFSHGLDDMLKTKSYKLHGILNGIDYNDFNPETDESLFQNYSAGSMKGKSVNKKKLQLSLGLDSNPDTAVVSMITRLVSHKGMDLVQYIFPRLMEQDIQFVLLGSGEWKYEKFFREMVSIYPGRLSVNLGFSPPLARKIYSGSDMFLMPSKSEPCGLSQMMSLRYGTIPIVRSTGGLKDSIVDVGEDGYGYTFQSYNADDMLGAIRRSLDDFNYKPKWDEIVQKAMACDFSWGVSANRYIQLYKELLSDS